MIKTITINEDLVNEIQLKDATVQTMKDVVKNLIETHALEEKDIVTISPVFFGLQKRLSEAEVAFTKAKDAMIHEILDEETRKNLTFWNLDYFSCELTYETKE